MIKKLLVANCLAVLVLAAGCGKNKVVKAAEDMADEVCACKDTKCALDAMKKGQEKVLQMMDEKGTQSDVDAITAAGKRMQDCVQSLAKK